MSGIPEIDMVWLRAGPAGPGLLNGQKDIMRARTTCPGQVLRTAGRPASVENERRVGQAWLRRGFSSVNE